MARPRRLPGFRFEVQSPPLTDVLPRMDVAAFVGFAASGPLHRPVPVESAAQFEMLFGADAPLVWDEARGEPVFAYLAPAVRAFFRNGGRRAWIIRVAGGEAQTNHFPLPSLLQATFNGAGDLTHLQPAFAQARSAGSWSDTLRVSTSLLSRSVAFTLLALNPPEFDSTLTSLNELVIGDLLRVTFKEGYELICAVKSIGPSPSSPPAPNRCRLVCDKAIWLRPSWAQAPERENGQAYTFTHTGSSAAINAHVPWRAESPIMLDWPTPDQRSLVKLNLDLPHTAAPQPGSLLRADFGSDSFWLRVETVGAVDAPGSPLFDGLQINGQGRWQTPIPNLLPSSIDLVERLSFELWTRAGESSALRLSELAFDLRHPRGWDALPTDLQLFPEIAARPNTAHADLWSAAANPRFPLAGEEHSNVLFIPLAMPPAPDLYLKPDPQVADALVRDGLSDFNSSLFLDPALAEVGARDLINEADTLRYQGSAPRSLAGIHAILDIEEVTLIAVPDAVQRGWKKVEAVKPNDPLPSDPILRPEWWHFLECDPERIMQPVAQPEWGNFLNCDLRLIEAPLLLDAAPDQLGTFTLTWVASPPFNEICFVLEEAPRADFVGVLEIYRGPDDRYTLYGHAPGIFYYRVRSVIGGQTSDWSNGQVVSIAPLKRWVLEGPDQFPTAQLLQLQHALLRLCAARGDLFAVLALPEHYRANEALKHIQTLTTERSDFFGPADPRTLSFGAVYHPWLIGREENRPDELRRTPPDGALAGIIARRTLARGAWIASANEFLKGVVALAPPIERGHRLDLQAAQLNLIRHEPKGFTAMNNDTLTPDEDLRPINVRRLLILLRRLALRLGATYVFEPNDDAFRRSVQRGFEALLDLMFQRGAFAGATAATSYQVVTDSAVNTPVSVDQGRFIVELRVAPSLPLTFLTLRLVQTGDRALVMQEQ